MKNCIFLIVLVFASCGPNYDGETRLISEIQVVDSNGDPISNCFVNIEVEGSGTTETVCSGLSDSFGKTLLIFPAPDSRNPVIALYISQKNDFPEVDTYYSRTIDRIRKSDFIDYKLPISQITLYRPEELTNLYFQYYLQTNISISTLEIVGEVGGTSRFDGSLHDNFNPPAFVVKKNQILTINYTVYNSETSESFPHSEEVTIGEEDVLYTLNF